jgi:HEAT repeat protein
MLGLAAEAKPTEALLADLDDGDARVRDHAVRALADRRDRAAVPALIQRLHDPDVEVAHRAVGALSQIGDPRAVPAIIELSRGADPALTLRLVRIVGDMGGLDAEGWLATLAEAHQEPRVREAAREALAELRRGRTDRGEGR